MEQDIKAILEQILSQSDTASYVHSDEIPGIELYMDQVTTFMEQHLGENRRNPQDKVLTKTMINNYTKNKLLPPPVKKKYSQDHMLLLIFIYYYKNVLSLQDIQNLLGRLPAQTEQAGVDIRRVYDEIFDMASQRLDEMKGDILSKCDHALDSFQDLPDEQRSFFQLFGLISDLALDVCLKKHVIEALIDRML